MAPRRLHVLTATVCVVLVNTIVTAADGDLPGVYIGDLDGANKQINGQVFALNKNTILLTNFRYDADTPAAFHAGKFSVPNDKGYRLPFRRVSSPSDSETLTRIPSPVELTISLPPSMDIRQFQWFSLQNAESSKPLSVLNFPPNLQIPEKSSPIQLQKISSLSHDVQSNPVFILDEHRLLVPGFYYDGLAPDAYFWVGKGKAPNARGMPIPDEKGSSAPLTKYDGQDLELVLPEGMRIHDVDWLAIWCVSYKINMGWVPIPRDITSSLPSTN